MEGTLGAGVGLGQGLGKSPGEGFRKGVGECFGDAEKRGQRVWDRVCLGGSARETGEVLGEGGTWPGIGSGRAFWSWARWVRLGGGLGGGRVFSDDLWRSSLVRTTAVQRMISGDHPWKIGRGPSDDLWRSSMSLWAAA